MDWYLLSFPAGIIPFTYMNSLLSEFLKFLKANNTTVMLSRVL